MELTSKYIKKNISIFIFLKVEVFFCLFVKRITKQTIAKNKLKNSSTMVAPLNTKALVIIEIHKTARYSWCFVFDKDTIKYLDNEFEIDSNSTLKYSKSVAN